MLRVLFVALAACSTVEAAIEDPRGTVYVCSPGCPADPPEYCWNGSRAELEVLMGGATCHAETWSERFWPAFAGCVWGCEPHAGCNAHCGCAGCS